LILSAGRSEGEHENKFALGFLRGLHDIVKNVTEPEKTFPSDSPQARIDYIFGTPNIKGITAAAIDSPASDHRPVLADIEIIPQA
jgi:endonuclease/exonuclease/phosphatase family metal-dependent hydrolase